MTTSEESPAQKAARLRRERREARIKDDGASRLDKITSMSGRSPTSAHEAEPSRSRPSSSATSTPETTTQAQQPSETTTAAAQEPAPTAPATTTTTTTTTTTQNQSSEDPQAQQQYEYIRALLRGNNAPAEAKDDLEEDPMRMLNTMLQGMNSGDQGGATPSPAGTAAPQQSDSGSILGLSPAQITAILGLPSFCATLLEAAVRPDTPEGKKQILVWKTLHALFAFGLGIYMLFLVGSSIATFGGSPPPPATAQNPFVVFVTGELLLVGARVLAKTREGSGIVTFGTGAQLFRDVVHDGRVALFLLGLGSWWHGGWKA